MTGADIAGMLQRGWAWWAGELVAMAPPAWRADARRAAAAVVIRPTAHETELERVHDGVVQRFVDPRPLAALDDDAWDEMGMLAEGRPIRLLLSAPETHALTLTLPRVVGTRLRPAVALQLIERAPVALDQLRWNIGRPSRDGDALRVAVAMVRVDRARDLTETFVARGLPPPSIVALTDAGEIMLEERRELGGRRRWPAWAIAALLLLTIPFSTIAIARTFSWMDARAVDDLAPQVETVTRAERHARARAEILGALAPLARAVPASRILDALARALPPSCALTRAEDDGRGTLTLAVDAPDGETVDAALDRDPLFRFTRTDETIGDDGRAHLTYRGRKR